MRFGAYKILGCHPAMEEQEYKHSHRILSQKYHPDRPTADPDLFMQVQEAWRMLKSPTTRREYRLRMQGLGTPCPECDGDGYKRIRKKFTTIGKTACVTCGGDGYLPR